MADDKPGFGAGISQPPVAQAELPESPAQALEPKSAPQLDIGSNMPYQPNKGRRGGVISRFLNLIGALVMLSALSLAGVLTYAKTRFEAMGPLQGPQAIQITSGMGVGAIALHLEETGIISNAYIFIGGIRLHRAGARLKAGEYAFPEGASMRTVMTMLVDGKSILRKITLPEGLTSEQIITRINASAVLSGKPVAVPGEGTLLPETYRFTKGLTRKAFVAQMQSAQSALIDKLWDKRDKNLPYTTKLEALTLASIVEKETGVTSERGHIAGVFVNRLRKGMRLQSDPTVIYGLVGGKGSLGHPIRLSELNSQTPYNTYKIKALPPGPIANPGAAAIQAVLNPTASKDLFFVADGSGGHAFAETLIGHRKNVLKWRKIEKKRKQTSSSSKSIQVPTQPVKTPAKPVIAPAKPVISTAKPKPVTSPAEKPQPDDAASQGSVRIKSKPLILDGSTQPASPDPSPRP